MISIKVLSVLDYVTRSIIRAEDRRDEDFRTLRKGLAYSWSVVIAAYPEAGKPVFEELLNLDDPDILWIMNENLTKNRLVRMDEEWVKEMLKRIDRQIS